MTLRWWTRQMPRALRHGLAFSLVGASLLHSQSPEATWSAYGGDQGGSRFAPLRQINAENVSQLQVAWSTHTGDLLHKGNDQGEATGCARCHKGSSKFEATPIIAGGLLYVSTPFNRVVAMDPASGRERWRFDPHLALNRSRNEGYVSRGVSWWADSRSRGPVCAQRIFFATVDARLYALDAATGRRCESFGTHGEVRLDLGIGRVEVGQYGVTSPPVVMGDRVIVGSAIGDNRAVQLEHGTVRAYDARSGRLLWAWDPIPRRASDPGASDWSPEARRRTGAANAWAPMSADSALGLLFVPTGSASPDFFGGERPGNNLYANSVVALDAATGKIRWHFQTVHHDLWDYDVPAQPTLADVDKDGRSRPAVIVASKTGFLFILDRVTGKPLFPVNERPVPASTVRGERASPTQPFPTLPRPLHPLTVASSDIFGATPADEKACREQFASFRNEGIFTPPSVEGSLMFPGYGGGVNWGGVSVDPMQRLLIVNTSRLPAWVKLRPRDSTKTESGMMRGTPYDLERAVWVGPSGLPCVKGPWGMLTAVSLKTGEVVWEHPLGSIPGVPAESPLAKWGTPNFGGALVTAGGVTFISAAMDEYLRAFETTTGRELWKIKLPAGGQATPMSYMSNGRQYIVIAAGGHGNLGTRLGDNVVAFALPMK